MSTWTLSDGTHSADIRATITTRGQLGALAAGATVERCGGDSPMQRVMGRGPATSFVRTLWSDWVRPTMRLFTLQFSGLRRGNSPASRFPVTFGVTFSASPLLLGVASAPAMLPSRFGVCSWVDRTHVVVDSKLYQQTGLDVIDVVSRSKVASIRGPPDQGTESYVNSKWAAVVRYNRRGGVEFSAPDTLAVARIREKPEDKGERKGEGKDDGKETAGRQCVVVEMTVGHCSECENCPLKVKMFRDQYADSEVVVTQSRKRGSVTSIFVVDLEQTYNSGSLAIVSTTTCVLPTGHLFESMIVLRNSETKGRTFIVRTHKGNRCFDVCNLDEGTGIATHIMHNAVDMLQEWFRIYHRDRPTKSENYLVGLRHSKEHKGKHVRRFLAESGFIFNVFANTVDVIEPTSGTFVLTLSFSQFASINLTAPLSCHLFT
ncbi:hypothetical protein Pelo_17163 [Pelomyxa schiedti]|nr:hypothetical protein Pelo_17163 [Pelomyxa schiedti]